MAVASATLVHDTTIWIRDLLLTKVTDPYSSSRQTNSKFVMTAWPTRPVDYPLILVQNTDLETSPLGMQSESEIVRMTFEIDVHSKSTRERDEVSDSVMDVLRSNQLGTGESLDQGLFDFKIEGTTNADDPGKDGVHRKIIMITYTYIANAS